MKIFRCARGSPSHNKFWKVSLGARKPYLFISFWNALDFNGGIKSKSLYIRFTVTVSYFFSRGLPNHQKHHFNWKKWKFEKLYHIFSKFYIFIFFQFSHFFKLFEFLKFSYVDPLITEKKHHFILVQVEVIPNRAIPLF